MKKYPSEILPNPNYKHINSDLFNHYLIRFTTTNNREDIYDETLKQVKQEHICTPRDRMNDLSTSLLGVYDTKHIHIELTELGNEKFGSYCEPDEDVIPPEYQTEFINNPNRGFWVILIKKINGIRADYTNPNISKQCNAICKIQHTPAKWNYWHFSIRWDLGDGIYWHQLPEKEKKKMAKRLGGETRSIIAKYAEIEEPNYSQLEKFEYCKKISN